MRGTQSRCSELYFKKLDRAPTDIGAENKVFVDESPTFVKRLLWFKSNINGQLIDCLLDCGASVSCIARRCVNANPLLRKLPMLPFHGPSIVDVNGNPLVCNNIIVVNLSVGTPPLQLSLKLVIVDKLPYSCIIGTNFLNILDNWSVDNRSSTLRLNNTMVSLHSQPQYDGSINLITSEKIYLQPNERKMIKTKAVGPGVSANRPFSEHTLMIEGFSDKEARTSLITRPSLNTIGHNNDTVVYIEIMNTSPNVGCLNKGTKVAYCHRNFREVDLLEEKYSAVNVINTSRVLDVLCDASKYKHLSQVEFNQVKELLYEFEDVFSLSNDTIGRANNSQFHINSETISPVSDPLRRVPLHKENIVRELIKQYEQLGIIEKIDSPFRAPTVLVEKKNVDNSESVTDRFRLCCDYRSLNRELEDSKWPTPLIEHCLDSASGSCYFSSLDFNSGFHQIPCTEDAKYALAFSPGVGFGQYTWNTMPQGVKTASNNFQRSMESTFNGLERCMLPAYYDDVMVKGKTFKEHLQNVRSVLSRIRKCGYTLNALKCTFFQLKAKYLGHILENGNVTLDPDRVAAITECETPKDLKALRRFLGMSQYCSRFIPKFNDKLTPLYDLLRKNKSYVWNEDCQRAFDYVKTKLTSAPILKSPCTSDNFILETDASDTGIGCCLKTHSRDGEHIVAYHSGKLSENEIKWNIMEKEAYAILKGVEKFRHYLLGKKFILKTDNRVLAYLKTSNSKKLLNWALKLGEFDFDIIHIPSSDNRISDFCSRLFENVNAISTMVPIITTSDLIQAQSTDEYIKNAISYVKCRQNFDVATLGPLKRFRKLLTVNGEGVLCWKQRIVVPEVYRSLILNAAHDHNTAGHFAEDRTWTNVTSLYFWPGAHNDVINWVRSCKLCNAFDTKVYVKRPLQPIPSTGRFELVCYDIAGPFLTNNVRGNLYCLIIVDHFTKWPEMIPLPNITAPTISRTIFEQWCCRYGVMSQLHSDGCNNVHSEIMKILCDLIGTVKSKSSRLHPQGDGMSESMVKILKTSLKKQVDEHGSDWDLHVQATAFAIRSAINSGTKYTPAELVFGDNIVRPIDFAIEKNSPIPRSKRNAKEFAVELADQIENASKIVNSNLENSRNKMKNTYDKKMSTHKFSIGDSVMLWWPYFKEKIPRAFQPKWDGPYTIVKLLGDTNCIIENNGNYKNVHLNQLKQVASRKLKDLPIHPKSKCTEDETNIFQELFDESCTTGNLENDNAPTPIINHGWCNLDESNILPSRTRSRLDRVGVG